MKPGNVHLIFAVITPLLTPDPSNSVTFVFVLTVGVLWPLVVRGVTVTFDPLEDVYTTNMFDPPMLFP